MVRVDEQVIEVAALDTEQRSNPFAEVSQPLDLACFATVAVDGGSDERLDRVVFVNPSPDQALVIVGRRPLVKRRVAPVQARPRFELIVRTCRTCQSAMS